MGRPIHSFLCVQASNESAHNQSCFVSALSSLYNHKTHYIRIDSSRCMLLIILYEHILSDIWGKEMITDFIIEQIIFYGQMEGRMDGGIES